MSNPLLPFTTEQLLAEIEKRRWESDHPDVENWCEDCIHFKVWTKRGDAPNDYNPCGFKHKTAFACPMDDYTGDQTGFYRLWCEDFKQEKKPDGYTQKAQFKLRALE